jgi:hypothetical protein
VEPEAKKVNSGGASAGLRHSAAAAAGPCPYRDFRAETGLLIPDIRSTAANGVEFADTFYWRLE